MRSSGRSTLSPKPIDHRLRDETDAVFCATEAPCIVFRVLADNEALGDDDTAVDHNFREPSVAADRDVRKHNRVRQYSIGVRPYPCEEQRFVDNRPGDDAAAR